MVKTYKPYSDFPQKSEIKDPQEVKKSSCEERFERFKQDNFCDDDCYTDYVAEVLYKDKEIIEMFIKGLSSENQHNTSN